MRAEENEMQDARTMAKGDLYPYENAVNDDA